MLKRLYIDNYRCMVNFECHFAENQLILGPNGTGKSTIFDVLTLLRDFSTSAESSSRGFVGSTRTRWQDVNEQAFEMDVSGNGGTYKYRLKIDEWGFPVRPRVVLEEVLFDSNPIFRFSLGEVHLFNDRHQDKVQYPFDWNRSALATIAERHDNTILSWFKRWLSGLSCISPDPRRMSALAERETAVPEADLRNFADWYRHIRLESDDRALVDDLRDVIDGFQSMDLKDAGLGNRILRLTFSNGSDLSAPPFTYGFDELSFGQRVLVGLYTALQFSIRPGATVCFDEPDNFIALRELQPWLNKVLDRDIDDDNPSQTLFVSHHPELLDRMAFESGLIFYRPFGRHTVARLFSDPSLTGLSPAELVARGWENE